jgi:hypothetical protein
LRDSPCQRSQSRCRLDRPVPRVAYFPDSFHEVNGVAHTSRHFESFARSRNLPFLCVRAGDRAQAVIEEGNVWTLELPRSFLSFVLEKDLRLDPAFFRHIPLINEVLQRFQPDLIHITGPSEIGILGAGLAHHFTCRLPRAGTPMFTNTRRAARSGFCACCPSTNPLRRPNDRGPGIGDGGPVLLHGAGAVRAQS